MLTQEIRGKWNQLRGKVKQKWGQLTDDDLRLAEGGIDEIVGRIQSRTGETRDAIEKYLDQMVSGGNDVLEKGRRAAGAAMDRAGEMVDDVRDRASDMIDDAREHAADYYDGARRVVREHPGTSLAMVFGLGMLSGLVIGMMHHRD